MNNSELIKDLQSKGLSQETFYEAMSWDEFVKEQARLVEDDKALKALLILKKEEESVAEVSLEQVLTSSFQTAKDTIDKMTLANVSRCWTTSISIVTTCTSKLIGMELRDSAKMNSSRPLNSV